MKVLSVISVCCSEKTDKFQHGPWFVGWVLDPSVSASMATYVLPLHLRITLSLHIIRQCLQKFPCWQKHFCVFNYLVTVSKLQETYSARGWWFRSGLRQQLLRTEHMQGVFIFEGNEVNSGWDWCFMVLFPQKANKCPNVDKHTRGPAPFNLLYNCRFLCYFFILIFGSYSASTVINQQLQTSLMMRYLILSPVCFKVTAGATFNTYVTIINFVYTKLTF